MPAIAAASESLDPCVAVVFDHVAALQLECEKTGLIARQLEATKLTRMLIVARQIQHTVLFKVLVALLLIWPYMDVFATRYRQRVGEQESQL